MRLGSLRTLLATVAPRDLDIIQYDITSAYLHGTRKEEKRDLGLAAQKGTLRDLPDGQTYHPVQLISNCMNSSRGPYLYFVFRFLLPTASDD